MHANMELYRMFYAVAKEGSFSAAARQLFVSQSAVSQGVGTLEKQLGVKLFARKPRGVQLTAEGEVLYAYVDTGLSQLESGERELERMRQLEAGELKIGAGDAISGHFLLPYLGRFRALYPDIHLQVINRTSEQTIELLKEGRVDLAFVNLPYTDEGLTMTQCLTVHDIFVANGQYERLKGRKVPLKELAKEHLILLENLSNSRRYVNHFFAARGIELTPGIELGAHDLLLEFAAIGLGVSCVIKEFAEEFLESGAVFQVQLEEEIEPRAMGYCTQRSAPLSFAAQKFIDIIK